MCLSLSGFAVGISGRILETPEESVMFKLGALLHNLMKLKQMDSYYWHRIEH